MKKEKSVLEKLRLAYQPGVPSVIRSGLRNLKVKEQKPAKSSADSRQIKKYFPKTFSQPFLRIVKGKGGKVQKPLCVGLVLSGGQAPGGHNVIIGIFDGIRDIHPQSRLFGFKGGPKGVFSERYEELDPQTINAFRNTGGFDMIGSGRDKIDSPEHLAACKSVCEKLNLDALVIIGGDDSNTNAAVLAEYFLKHEVKTSVIGIPKTIDGDLKSDQIEASFGFDTACKVYSELIGNICRDALSAKKYWHFIKLMGRSASHVTLECAFQTQPNIALIGEEVNQKKMTLARVVKDIALVVKKRADSGKFFGVCLVPEGLIEFIPEIRTLINELNALLAEHEEYFKTLNLFTDQQEFVNQKLSKESSQVFSGLPAKIQQQLLYDRDKHGNVQVSKIETEYLLIEQVRELLGEWASKKKIDPEISRKFNAQSHFFGYEGRCSFPSNFDANYTYSLGRVAAILIAFGKTGYMASLSDLTKPADKWQSGGVPLTSLMNIEKRKGKKVPVIKKALVDTKGDPFKAFAAKRALWEMREDYVFPGAIQYFGPPAISDVVTQTLLLERKRKKS